MQHTPAPWSVEQPMDEEFAIVQSGLEAHEWQFIAVCPVGTPAEGAFSRQRSKINAAFIVKACNAHEDLIAHLRRLAIHACDDAALDFLESVEPVSTLASADRETVGGEK